MDKANQSYSDLDDLEVSPNIYEEAPHFNNHITQNMNKLEKSYPLQSKTEISNSFLSEKT